MHTIPIFTYEYEWTCIACGYNVKKRRNLTYKIQRKNQTSPTGWNMPKKTLCLGIDVYRIYEGANFNEVFEVLSKL